MLIKPQALLLDEPFSALDSQVRQTLQDLVIDLSAETDIPTLLVTHDLEEALVFGQDIAIIADGQNVEHGSKEEILQAPQFVETAKLLGFQYWPLTKQIGPKLLTTRGDFSFSGPSDPKAEFVCIRPENIMLIREDLPLAKKSRENLLCGTVQELHHRASFVRLIVRSDQGQNYIIHSPTHVMQVMGIKQGKKITFSLKKDALVLCRQYRK